jgi:hypothetical protein
MAKNESMDARNMWELEQEVSHHRFSSDGNYEVCEKCGWRISKQDLASGRLPQDAFRRCRTR